MRLLKDVEAINLLAKRLANIGEIRKFDNGDEPESWKIAYNFSELEDSFNQFLSKFLPELLKENITDKEMIAVLDKIGMEFRHQLFHMQNSKFYRIFLDSGPGPQSSTDLI